MPRGGSGHGCGERPGEGHRRHHGGSRKESSGWQRRGNVHGLRFEWNDELDFGHLLDPVPLSVFAAGGKSAEVEFSQAELARVASVVDAANRYQDQSNRQTLAGET